MKMAEIQHRVTSRQQQRRQAIMSVVRPCLELNTLEEYQQWCAEQGFCLSLNKTQQEVLEEYRRYRQRRAIRALKRLSNRRHLRTVIRQIYDGNLNYDELGSSRLEAIYDAFDRDVERKLLLEVMLWLVERSRLLENENYIHAISMMVTHHSAWINDYHQWRAESKNIHRQYTSLVRFLFCRYDMPEFMYRVWLGCAKKPLNWFLHLAGGSNIRTAKNFPVRLTQKMAHYYLQAPAYYTPWTAIRWAQVLALGGNSEIADAVAETRLGREFIDDEFWISVIQFFINHPELDRVHFGSVVDYIFNQKYENRGRGDQLQDDCDTGGQQPGFSMKGRRVDALLRLVHEWHLQLAEVSKLSNEKWKSSNIADFRYVEKGEGSRESMLWTIRELLSSHELHAEGNMQNHCVAGYDEECLAGESSIWTMDVSKSGSRLKLLTIEVMNKRRQIIQVRGRHNRTMYAHELSILKKWAARAKLGIADAVLEEA